MHKYTHHLTILVLSSGHVNNVVYVRYAESARVNLIQNFANYLDPMNKTHWLELVSSKGTGLILGSMTTDYKFVCWSRSTCANMADPGIILTKPMTYPDRITVYHKLHSRPSPSDFSFALDVMILSELHQRPAARCFENIVTYDYLQQKKTALPPWMLEQFVQTFDLQEAMKDKVGQKVRNILERVRALEKASWDRPDAVESFGPAS